MLSGGALNHSQPRPRARSYTKKFTGCGLGVDCGVWPHKAAALDNKTKKQRERRTPTSKMIAGFLRQWISQLLWRRFLLEKASDRKAVPAPGLSVDRDRSCVGFTNIGGASINESTPVVNHPGVGIYLNPRVEIVRAAGETRLRPGERAAAICKSCKTGTFPGARDSAESKTEVSSKPRAAGVANRLR